jgi:type I restriction enzyme M protein
VDEPAAYHAEGILYLPAEARFDYLLNRPEAENIGAKVNAAMRDIEKHNPQLAGVLPKTYNLFTSTLLKELLKKVSEIPASLDYDAFGRIYEYFLGEFAMSEGQGGGEFYTPSSIVRLLTEIIEPYHGRILDPACGSGGMFVSVRAVRGGTPKRIPQRNSPFTASRKPTKPAPLPPEPCRPRPRRRHQTRRQRQQLLRRPARRHWQIRLRPRQSPVQRQRRGQGAVERSVGHGRRFPFGLPRTDNANYLWIQLFYSALNEKGRAGFVMANSASDARSSEQELRRQLIESRAVDVMVAVGPNLFYTVTLPCTLWFLDKSKKTPSPAAPRHPLPLGERAGVRVNRTVPTRFCLLMPATSTGRWIAPTGNGRPRRLAFLANLVRLYRGEEPRLHPRRRRSSRKKKFRREKGLRQESRNMPTCPACAVPPRSRKLKPRAGRSIPAATLA